MAPVSNKALVVIVFPITIGILQSWWITYFAGAKNKGFICCHCSLILFKVCSPLLFFVLLTLAPVWSWSLAVISILKPHDCLVAAAFFKGGHGSC